MSQASMGLPNGCKEDDSTKRPLGDNLNAKDNHPLQAQPLTHISTQSRVPEYFHMVETISLTNMIGEVLKGYSICPPDLFLTGNLLLSPLSSLLSSLSPPLSFFSSAADMLCRLIAHNDHIPLTPKNLTRFHSRAPPGIGVHDYLRRIVKYTSLERSVLLALLIYIDRACENHRIFTISSLTVHRFVLTAITVAAKSLCDSYCTNTHYAKVGGVSLQELNNLELELLFLMNWNLNCMGDTLQQYYVNLVRHHAGPAVTHSSEGEEMSRGQLEIARNVLGDPAGVANEANDSSERCAAAAVAVAAEGAAASSFSNSDSGSMSGSDNISSSFGSSNPSSSPCNTNNDDRTSPTFPNVPNVPKGAAMASPSFISSSTSAASPSASTSASKSSATHIPKSPMQNSSPHFRPPPQARTSDAFNPSRVAYSPKRPRFMNEVSPHLSPNLRRAAKSSVPSNSSNLHRSLENIPASSSSITSSSTAPSASSSQPKIKEQQRASVLTKSPGILTNKYHDNQTVEANHFHAKVTATASSTIPSSSSSRDPKHHHNIPAPHTQFTGEPRSDHRNATSTSSSTQAKNITAGASMGRCSSSPPYVSASKHPTSGEAPQIWIAAVDGYDK